MSQLELDVWQRGGTKGDFSSPFLASTCSRGEGRTDLKKWRISRERKCNFSLDFPAFGPSVRVRTRSKVVLCGKGYAWTSVLWSFDNFGR